MMINFTLKKNFLTEDIYKVLQENSSLLSINNNQKKSISL